MKKHLLTLVLSFSIVSSIAQKQPGKLAWNINPYENKVFIENKGQFDSKNGIGGGKIKYGITNLGTEFYFTSSGWTYRHDEKRGATEDETMSIEKANAGAKADGKEENEHKPTGKTIVNYLNMNWVGANPDAQIVASDPVTEYFNYIDLDHKPGTTIRANAWKKITYQNLYPGIDVEYTFPENKRGIEYALILHPGADPSVIKMLYSGMSDILMDEDKNIEIQTSFGDFIDHAPASYYKDGASVESAFQLSGNVVSFKFNPSQISNLKSQTLIIDPWIADPGLYLNYDAAYDVEYDNAGNVYIYGGGYEYTEIKYNSAGVPQWSSALNFYNEGCGPFGLYSCYGDFAVDAVSGYSYLVEGFNFNNGARVGKLDNTGTLIASWIPGADTRITEMWRIVFNNCTKQAIIAGGGVSQTYQACLLDTTLSILTPVNVLSASDPYHDFTLLTIDNYSNCFMATNQKSGEPGVFDNVLLECPASTSLSPNSYMVSDNHTFVEVSSIPYVDNITSLANGFNGIAANASYVYTYDGGLLQKWNKSNGTLVTSRTLSATKFAWGGLDIDDCDSIYVGFGSAVLKLDPTTLNTVSTVQNFSNNIYDIKLGPGNLLYVAGEALVATVTLPVTCGALNLSVSSTPDTCSSKGTASVTVSGGVGPFTYIWSPSGKSTTSITGLSAGSYTVTVTDLAFTPCARSTGGTQTIAVAVASGPLPSIGVSGVTGICSGASVVLTASGGVSYTWSPITGLSSGSGTSVTANPTTTTTYTVTGIGANGCPGTTGVTVSVSPKPTISVNPSAPILCNGQSVSLSGVGGSTYVWAPGTGLSGTTGTTVSANPTSTTTYTVTGTNASGCTNTSTVTVTVNPKPGINVNPSAPILCNGQSVSLTAGGGSTYIWSPGTGLSATTGTTVSANPTSTTSYTVTGTDGNGCTNTSAVTVTVNPKPTISVNPPSSILCNGQSVSLTASGGNTYTWNPVTGLSSGSGATVSANPTTTTTYTVTGTNGNGCTNTTSVTITINPKPTISVSPPSQVLCNGQSVLLTGSGGVSYVWAPGTGLSGTSGTTVSANPTTTTTYIVTGTDANGCTNTSSVTISINPKPTITVNPSAPILCNGQSVSLTAGGGNTYVWSPGTGLSATTGGTVSANPANSTTYTVTGTDGNGCTNTASTTVTINPKPTITVNPSSPILCNGQSVLLNAGGGITYVWNPATGLSSGVGASVSANPTTTTSYTVTGTDGNGCTNTGSATVTVNPKPTITVGPAAPILCNGQSVSLNAGGGNTYTWSPATGLSASTGSTVSANPSSTTAYIVTGTDGNGCTNTTSVTVTVNPLPTITANPSAPTLCNGASVLLTAGGGISYIWSPGTGLSATTGSTVSASPASTTTYTINGTDANGCTNTATVTVTVSAQATITVNPVAPILCNGKSVSLTAGGATTYVWSPGTGLSATTGATVSANPTSTTTYTVTGTESGGCSNTTTVTVTVNPLPTVTASPASPILCNGQSVSLNAGGGNTYVWSPGTGLSATTGSTVSADPTSTTMYTVTGTDGNGCTNTASITVTINQKPTITVNPSSPILCNGQSVLLTAGGGNTYVWSPTTGLSSGSGSTVSANPTTTATYVVTGTDGNGCTNTGSVTVTINPLPVISASPISSILCNGQSVTLNAGGGNTYVWTPSTGLSSGSGSTVSANPTSTTTYIVTGTDGNGCTNTASATVNINPRPTITANPVSPILCSGQSVSLTAGGGNTYVWSPSTGLSSGSGSTVSANPTSTTTYVVTGTDGNGCTNAASVTVTINPIPTVIVSPSAPVLCNGQSVSLTAGGANTYVWSPTTGLSSGSGSSVSANPNSTTTYIVTGSDGNGCTSTGTVTVSVNQLPVVTVSPNAPVLCNGQSVSLTASGGNTYVWNPTTGLSSGSGVTVSADPTATSVYIVTGTDGNGCSNTASVTVTVNPLPVITVNPTAPAICNGQSVSLTASGGSTYTWSPTTGLSSGSGSIVSANPVSTTTYIVTGTNGNGCSSTSSVTVSVNTLPVISVSPVAPVLCNGQSVSLTASGANTYAWTPGTGLSSGTGTTVSADPSGSTTYVVTGTDGNGCSSTSSVTVTVNPLPVVAVAPIAPAICFGQSVSLTASGGNTYSWNPTIGLSSGTGTIVSADPAGTTVYIVTGTDGNGCSNTATATVTVNPLPVVNAGPDANICPNDSAQLIVTGPPPGSTYTWTPATNLSCSSCSNPYASPQTTTTYIVSVSTLAGCSTQDTVNVIVTPLAPVAGPDTAICNGISVKLHASGGTSYQWTPTSTLDNPDIANPVATPSDTTVYTVTVSSGACSGTATVTIVVHPLVPTPTITQSSDTLYCSYNPIYSSYQWYYNDTIIPNATKTFYVAPKSGNYNVAVYDENGCSISVGINIIISGVGFQSFSDVSGFSLFPNPATNELFVDGYGPVEKGAITIFNMIGEMVQEEKIQQSSHTALDISNLSSGIYFIRVELPRGEWVGRFVKE